MYGLDLCEELWGPSPVGGRRLLSLVKWLPQTSAVWGVTHDGWTQEDELLATIVDMLGANAHLTLAVNVKEGTKLPEPARFPRPWEEDEEEESKNMPRAQSTIDEVRGFFGTQADDPGQVVVR